MKRRDEGGALLASRVRELLAPYGRDYALGAVHGLAVRNMVEVSLPPLSRGFYPLVKVHEMALSDLEEVFYGHLASEESVRPEDLVRMLVGEKVWE